jgi:adsorption protein B
MTPMDFVPQLAVAAILTRELLWLAGGAIFLSSLDDIAVDSLWLARVAFRPAEPLPPSPAPGRFAILVPAWDEAEVIGAMLTRLTATLEHPDYTVFVGTYPNDPATAAAVRAVDDPRIVLVEGTRPGPTTKADCLNQLWRGVLANEAATGRRFKAIVLHDAEDVVHPASLGIYDRTMPALAMVQLPVLPLPDPQSRWVSGHYLDEFAQNHAKDMMVRALLDAPVPSAGVGTAICRDALARIAGPGGTPFDASSLTEDYELGHKLHALGLKGRMIRVWVAGELVATREYFPATLEAAVRQKSRWLTGIALSGWDRLGWEGRPATRWMLMRDRKGLFTAAVAMLGYLAGVLLMGQLALRAAISAQSGQALPPLLTTENSLLPAFLLFNALLLLWRLGMRAGFTWRHYGVAEALRSVPRAILANAINFLSALRAAERYRATLSSGTAIDWDKTSHRFPTEVPHG